MPQFVFLGHRKMWTSTNYFLVNLSLTDLLMTILNGLFNFIYMRDNHWPFGDFYCTVNNFVAFYTVIGSVFTLTALTLDRYLKNLSKNKKLTSRTLFEKSIFCPKIQFWLDHNIFTSFSSKIFFDNFSREIKVVNS